MFEMAKDTWIIIILGAMAVSCLFVVPAQVEIAKMIATGLIGYLGASTKSKDK